MIKQDSLFIKMNFQIAIPSTILKPYIKEYWAVENVLGKGKVHFQRVIATGLPELTFYFENRPKSDKRKIEGSILLNGQQNDFYDLLITDKISMFSVTFQANGLSHFLRIPINELQNQIVTLDSVNKVLSQQLEDKLAGASTFQKRIEIVESFFINLLKNQIISVDQKRMTNSIELIKSTKGNISIEFLASNACVSRKQFERKFLAYIGISPKQYLKIIRFQNAIFLNQSTTNVSITELAYKAGYYDQSHFINEVKDLTGQTPKKLFDSEEIISDFFR